MFAIYILLFLLLLLILLDLVRGLRFRFSAHVDKENYKVEATLLYPFLRVVMKPDNGILKPKIYILGIGIDMPGALRNKKRPDLLKLAGSLHISNMEFVAAYGISDPCSTGLILGAMNFLMSFCSGIKKAEMYPDFFTVDDYLRLNASMDIQVGHTIFDYVRN